MFSAGISGFARQTMAMSWTRCEWHPAVQRLDGKRAGCRAIPVRRPWPCNFSTNHPRRQRKRELGVLAPREDRTRVRRPFVSAAHRKRSPPRQPEMRCVRCVFTASWRPCALKRNSWRHGAAHGWGRGRKGLVVRGPACTCCSSVCALRSSRDHQCLSCIVNKTFPPSPIRSRSPPRPNRINDPLTPSHRRASLRASLACAGSAGVDTILH